MAQLLRLPKNGLVEIFLCNNLLNITKTKAALAAFFYEYLNLGLSKLMNVIKTPI